MTARSTDRYGEPAAPGGGAGRSANERFALRLLPLRLFIAIGWLRVAAEHLLDPAWSDGSALQAFVTDQVSSGAVVAGWFAELMEAVAEHAQLASQIVIGTEIAIGVALVLGIVTGVALVVGMVANVIFLLAGVVNPSTFYLVIHGTLLLGDAGAAASLGGVLSRRPVGAPRGALDRRWVWRALATVLALCSGVCAAQITDLTPARLLTQPLVVLALLGGLGAVGALLRAETPGYEPGPAGTVPAPSAPARAAAPRPAPAPVTPAPPPGGLSVAPRMDADATTDLATGFLRAVVDDRRASRTPDGGVADAPCSPTCPWCAQQRPDSAPARGAAAKNVDLTRRPSHQVHSA